MSDVSVHTGGSYGRSITIQGYGFTQKSEQISVKAANLPCAVTYSDERKIVCTVQPDTAGNTYGRLATDSSSQVDGFISGSGLKYWRYNIAALSSKTTAGLRAAIASSSSSITVVE